LVFNATFNNISAILWWSVLLMGEIGVSNLDGVVFFELMAPRDFGSMFTGFCLNDIDFIVYL
jgi:hypothetical protein